MREVSTANEDRPGYGASRKEIAMNPSDALLRFLMSPNMENVVLTAYWDPTGKVWTNGMGHTGPNVFEGQVVDMAQVMEWARSDMATAAREVNKLLAAPIAAGATLQNEYDAFTSLGFNIGTGAEAHASAVASYLRGDKDDAARRFLLWDESGGAPLEGLLKRRKCEAIMLLGAPWRIAEFADESDKWTDSATLTACMTDYA